MARSTTIATTTPRRHGYTDGHLHEQTRRHRKRPQRAQFLSKKKKKNPDCSNDAIKVATSETLPQDTWTHVFVTYDGSSKAAGVAVYINGRAAKLDVLADQLKGTITTDEPLRLGKRSASLPLNGELADIRVYPRALTPDEVSRVADRPALLIARTPAKRRSESQRDVPVEILPRPVRRGLAPGGRPARDDSARRRRSTRDASPP